MQKRRSTRSNVWPDTDATIKVQDPRGINKSQASDGDGKSGEFRVQRNVFYNR